MKSWSHWSSGKISHGCSLRPYLGEAQRTSVWCHVGWHFQNHEKTHFCAQGLKVLTYHLCKSLISDCSCPAQSYPRSGEGSVFETWFSTGRNPLVRHYHPPSSSQHSCGAAFYRQEYSVCSEISMQMTGTRWHGKQRESRTGGVGKWLKWTVSESKVHQVFTTGVHMQVWQNYPASTHLPPPQPCVNNGQHIWNLSLHCLLSGHVSLWHAVKKTTLLKQPHLSELKQGDAWENKWSSVGGSSLDGVMDRVRAVRRKCSDHKHTLPVTSTKRHLLTWTGMLLAVQTLKAIQSWWTFSKPLSWAQDASSEDFPIPMLSCILNNYMDCGISIPLSGTPGVDHKWWQEKRQG